MFHFQFLAICNNGYGIDSEDLPSKKSEESTEDCFFGVQTDLD